MMMMKMRHAANKSISYQDRIGSSSSSSSGKGKGKGRGSNPNLAIVF
jgi:hypothetical protein